jgi:hypothetical protein
VHTRCSPNLASLSGGQVRLPYGSNNLKVTRAPDYITNHCISKQKMTHTFDFLTHVRLNVFSAKGNRGHALQNSGADNPEPETGVLAIRVGADTNGNRSARRKGVPTATA